MHNLRALVLAALFLVGAYASAQEPALLNPPGNLDLSIIQEDLWIEQGVDGGFHLFIRKKSAIASVLLTETTRDPSLKEPNYAYRTSDWNPINGDEIRLINEVPITRTSRVWSLIDSTPEIHPTFGEVFHIYIPYILYYGYENTRHGEIYVQDGTYFNIRTFTLPYGDYRGKFQDNPFILEVTQNPLEGPADRNYMRDTINRFAEITTATHGDLRWSREPADLVEKIKGILEKERRKSLDVVFCLDTTRSMQEDIVAIKRSLPGLLKEMAGEFSGFRVGMVLYQDYTQSAYLTRIIPFTENLDAFQKTLQAVSVGNGGDIPEAVYEALYEGLRQFPWESEAKLLILIGDAPPHPRPKGKINKDMVFQGAIEGQINIHAIILPQ
ncbi:MAG: VWA domain-containing protein [Treponema sp.]|jgi:Mg-chelatase subunit ChlD|nr:VWA domain-containing protein [Treponema sp.]